MFCRTVASFARLPAHTHNSGFTHETLVVEHMWYYKSGGQKNGKMTACVFFKMSIMHTHAGIIIYIHILAVATLTNGLHY